MDNGAVKALRAAHADERRVFSRLIDMGIEVGLSIRVIAFWMCFESLGCKGVVREILSKDDKFLSQLSTEAKSILDCLISDQPNSPSLTPILSISPLTSNFANCSDVSFIGSFWDRERVSSRVSQIYDAIRSLVFDDILEERGLNFGGGDRGGGENKNEKGKEKKSDDYSQSKMFGGSKLNPFAKEWIGRTDLIDGGGGRFPAAFHDGPTASWSGGSRAAFRGGWGSEVTSSGRVIGSRPALNPKARLWNPVVDNEEGRRSLFITFSKGLPLSHNQVYYFFTWWFGPYVQKVYIHQPMESEPVFGKITFTAASVPEMIMCGSNVVKFNIGDRTIWCKKYNRMKRHLP